MLVKIARLTLALIVLLVGPTAAQEPSTERTASRPNVILIMTDDQGYGDIGRNGNPVVRTPHLDRLAEDSARFTNFHVDPTCSPTRAALMTGQHSLRAGVWHTIMGRSLLAPEKLTLAERLGALGYATGIFGKWHLGDNHPFRPQDQGFDRSVIHGGGGVGQTPDHWGNTQTDDTYYVDGEPQAFQGTSTDVWFDEAERFIRANRDRPFFAYIAPNAPHSPWRAPEAEIQVYLDMGMPRQLAIFYAMVEGVDRRIGGLRDMLQREGIERDTIFIFMTDNGSSLMATPGVFGGDPQAILAEARKRPGLESWTFNAGQRGFKGEVYEGGHRAPLYIRWPGGDLSAPRDIDALTAHFDVPTTIMDLVGSPVEEGELDGRSLAPDLRGGTAPSDRTLVVTNQRVDIPTLDRPNVVMTQRWRLVVHGERDILELYDIVADPTQRRNLAAEHSDVVADLRRRLDDWWTDIDPDPDVRQRIVIGSPREPLSRLTAMDWMQAATDRDVPWFPGFQPPVAEPAHVSWIGRETDFAPLPWSITAETAATYKVSAYLHDRPAARPVGRQFAIFEVNGRRISVPTPGLSSWGEFRVPIPTGDHELRAWFADDAEGETNVVPAFYLYLNAESDAQGQGGSR